MAYQASRPHTKIVHDHSSKVRLHWGCRFSFQPVICLHLLNSIDRRILTIFLSIVDQADPSFSSDQENTPTTTISGNVVALNDRPHLVNAMTSAIPSPSEFPSLNHGSGTSVGGGGSSTASSRDTSPCRESSLSPLVTVLKPPIVVRRGPRGFGFSVNTIRVYYGDTDFYTMHHLVMAVDESSSAYEAGLRPGDLITHVNGEPVQGLFHTQVLQLLLNNSHDENVTLRATPLEHTSIQSGGRKRDVHQSKLAKKSVSRQKKQRKDADKKRKTSLFRRISTKRASEQLTAAGGLPSPGAVTPSRSCQSSTMQGNVSRNDNSPTAHLPNNLTPLPNLLAMHSLSPAASSSASSSPSSSTPNTPTNLSNSSLVLGANTPHVYHHHHHHQRPSTLHGLKHKLHTSVVANKSISTNNSSIVSTPTNRRKSVGHIPLSPLARTPSPSPVAPGSPTRSPSPLAFPIVVPGHQLGSSNTTQSYSPGCVLPSSSTSSIACNSVGSCNNSSCTSHSCVSGAFSAIGGTKKTSFGRPKSADTNSPLLRRALSPDRLHPRSATENKMSPLCCSSTASIPTTSNIINMHAANAVVGLKKQRTPNANKIWHTPSATQKSQSTSIQTDDVVNQEELMPIAEEKDSPVNATGGSIIGSTIATDSNDEKRVTGESQLSTSTPVVADAKNSSQRKDTSNMQNMDNTEVRTSVPPASLPSLSPPQPATTTANATMTNTVTTTTTTLKKPSK